MTTNEDVAKAAKMLTALLENIFEAGKRAAFTELLSLAEGRAPVSSPKQIPSLRDAGKNWKKPRTEKGVKVRPSVQKRMAASKRHMPTRVGWLQKSLLLEIGTTGIQKDALWKRVQDEKGQLPHNVVKSVEALMARGLIRMEHGGYIMTQTGVKAAKVHGLLPAAQIPTQHSQEPNSAEVAA